MHVYKSRYACPPLPATSIFDFLLGEGSRAASVGLERAALIDGMTGEKVTYSALRQFSLHLANSLSALCTSLSTSTILLLSRSSIHFPPVVLAASAARLSVSLADPAATVYELVVQLKASGAGVVVVEADEVMVQKAVEAARRAGLRGEERVVVIPCAVRGKGMTAEEVRSKGLQDLNDLTQGENSFEPVTLTEEQAKTDLAYMPWSGGLGGAPKLTHISPYNVTSQLIQIAQTTGIFNPGDVKLSALPMAYALGSFIELFISLHLGGTLVIYPSFDLKTILAGVEKYCAQTLVLVGPLVPLFIHDLLLEKYDLSSLRWIGCGGSPVPSSAQRALTRRLTSLRSRSSTPGGPVESLFFFQAGGMTECTALAFLPSLEEGRDPMSDGTVGGLVAGMEARVVAGESGARRRGEGRDVGKGEEGELWLRGASVSKGYVRDSLASNDAFPSDGWLRTGDLVKVSPGGVFTYTGRLKPIIKNKGLQANPVQIEGLIYSTGLVEDCVVVGVWNSKFFTELPRAYVVAKQPAVLPPAELAAFVKTTVKKHLSPQKWFAGGVELVEAIPRRKDGSLDAASLSRKKQGKVEEERKEIRSHL
ncbi:hypothetical protein JCM6882_003143 [Rhodosporidiobolus microsporus]